MVLVKNLGGGGGYAYVLDFLSIEWTKLVYLPLCHVFLLQLVFLLISLRSFECYQTCFEVYGPHCQKAPLKDWLFSFLFFFINFPSFFSTVSAFYKDFIHIHFIIFFKCLLFYFMWKTLLEKDGVITSENRSRHFFLHIISCKVICIYCVQMLNKKMRKWSLLSWRFVYYYLHYNTYMP